ncbi:alcohol dehydrogenase 2 [Trichomonascus vanleenenianus]|uniref:alcohol dehydrogenase 2 n=1 Tax=Trichomonascus vanleenenianus TaxID=2268995 RepID=UPI003ECB6F3C
MTANKMLGAVFHGKRTVEVKEFPVPEPQVGQVLLKMHASSLCGSDLRCMYRVDTLKSTGPDGYKGVIGGHEPCGQIVKLGPNVNENDWKVNDRVVVYHIHGCGNCRNCRAGQYISCSSKTDRRAYGWQRDGGNGQYILADVADLVKLQEPLTYIDGSMIACGLSTAYAATLRAQISGRDVVLITGMGPVGIGAALLAEKEGATVFGLEIDAKRREIAQGLGITTFWTDNEEEILARIGEPLGPSVVIDCSGNSGARLTGLKVAREWARIVFVGEGNDLHIPSVSDIIIHKSLAIYGSWVSSIQQMEDLVEKLVRWGLSAESMVTDVYTVDQAVDAYKKFDSGQTGKVVIVSKEEAARWKAKST